MYQPFVTHTLEAPTRYNYHEKFQQDWFEKIHSRGRLAKRPVGGGTPPGPMIECKRPKYIRAPDAMTIDPDQTIFSEDDLCP